MIIQAQNLIAGDRVAVFGRRRRQSTMQTVERVLTWPDGTTSIHYKGPHPVEHVPSTASVDKKGRKA